MRPPSRIFPAPLARHLLATPVLLGLCLLTVVLGKPMHAHSDALVNAAAPHGILSLQFTCSAEAAQHLLNSWRGGIIRHASLSLYWDFAFALAYGLSLALLTERFMHHAQTVRHGFPVWLAWLPLLAAGLDVLENLFHLRLIQQASAAGQSWTPGLACAFALCKWGLLALWLLRLMALLVRSLHAGLRHRAGH
ncbi:MAG TPA: hypothetical protein PKH69_09920 [Thiobacillaceae bacterium]|nr:hypothetical protein [Thiobacillaceae bacterium]HNU64792.1 hypothetical protein [Thiobacillaceae bacterium]